MQATPGQLSAQSSKEMVRQSQCLKLKQSVETTSQRTRMKQPEYCSVVVELSRSWTHRIWTNQLGHREYGYRIKTSQASQCQDHSVIKLLTVLASLRCQKSSSTTLVQTTSSLWWQVMDFGSSLKTKKSAKSSCHSTPKTSQKQQRMLSYAKPIRNGKKKRRLWTISRSLSYSLKRRWPTHSIKRPCSLPVLRSSETSSPKTMSVKRTNSKYTYIY